MKRNPLMAILLGAAVVTVIVFVNRSRVQDPGSSTDRPSPNSSSLRPANPSENGSPDIVQPAPDSQPLPRDPGEAEEIRLRSSCERFEKEMLLTYRYAGIGNGGFSRVLLDQQARFVARYPDFAFEYYRARLLDSDLSMDARIIALDSLSVLARSGHGPLEQVLRSLPRDDSSWPWRLSGSAIAVLAAFYPGESTRAFLLERAVAGSMTATEALGNTPSPELEAITPTNKGHAKVLELARNRSRILSSPDARIRLAALLKKKPRRRDRDLRREILWASEAAATQGYKELAPLVRDTLHQYVRKTLWEGSPGIYWKGQYNDPQLLRVVLALSKLTKLTDGERSYFDRFVLCGPR